VQSSALEILKILSFLLPEPDEG